MKMSEVNIFELATRQKLRFDAESLTGLTTEQLWDLPLQSNRTTTSTLDGVGKIILRALREQEEESLVTPANTGPKTLMQLKLEVVKSVIATKQAENAAKVDAAKRAQERDTLRQLLAEKHADELKGLTKEQIEAKLKELGG
jgi:hypothetical protein